MRPIAVSLALAGMLGLSACQGMDADTAGRTVGGAGGLIYDQTQKR